MPKELNLNVKVVSKKVKCKRCGTYFIYDIKIFTESGKPIGGHTRTTCQLCKYKSHKACCNHWNERRKKCIDGTK